MAYCKVTKSWPQVRFSTWDGWCMRRLARWLGRGRSITTSITLVQQIYKHMIQADGNKS